MTYVHDVPVQNHMKQEAWYSADNLTFTLVDTLNTYTHFQHCITKVSWNRIENEINLKMK